MNFSNAPSPTFWQGLLLSGRKTSAALRTVEVRRDSSNCQCSTQPHVRLLRRVCLFVWSGSRTCDHPLSPLIITNWVSQALASKSVGHRAGIKQQNNGVLPLLNLLMGSQWLPRPSATGFTYLAAPARACVRVCECGGSMWCCCRGCCVCNECRCETRSQIAAEAATGSNCFMMSHVFLRRWQKGVSSVLAATYSPSARKEVGNPH